MRPAVHDASALDVHDLVGELDRRPPVRHDHHGRRCGRLAQRREDRLLHPRVQRAGRVVEDEQARLSDQGARQRDALALAPDSVAPRSPSSASSPPARSRTKRSA
jgi:hypothetical protein